MGGEVGSYPLPDFREGISEFDQPGELGVISDLTPPLVIAVLLSVLVVDAGCLEVTVGIFADPYATPCRWMVSSSIRRRVASSGIEPSAAWYVNPRPQRRRAIPGAVSFV